MTDHTMEIVTNYAIMIAAYFCGRFHQLELKKRLDRKNYHLLRKIYAFYRPPEEMVKAIDGVIMRDFTVEFYYRFVKHELTFNECNYVVECTLRNVKDRLKIRPWWQLEKRRLDRRVINLLENMPSELVNELKK